MATKKSGRFKAQVTPDFDESDYHYETLARKTVLEHPEVKRRIATTKKRLREAAILPDEDEKPPKPRTKSDVQIPRNVRSPSQAKDAAPVKGVAQVATTTTPKPSTSTRKRGSKARY
jgi:hypothetical protein